MPQSEIDSVQEQAFRIAFPTDGPSPLEESFKRSSIDSPDKSAKIISLAEKTGESSEFVAQNMAYAETAAKFPGSNYFAEIQAKYPHTARMFSDQRMMAAAHDDLDNAAKHEDEVKKFSVIGGLGRAAVYGLAGLEAQVSGIPKLAGIPLGESQTKFWRDLQKSYETPEMRESAIRQLASGDVVGLSHQVLASGPSIILPTIATVAGVPAAPTLAIAGLLAASGKFAATTEEGKVSPAVARINAALTGAFEAGTEAIHVRAITKWAGALAQSFGKDTARQIVFNASKAIAANFGQEAGEEGLNSAAEQITDVFMGVRAWTGTTDFVRNVMDAMTIGGVSGAALGGPSAVYLGSRSAQAKRQMDNLVAEQAQRAQQAKDFYEAFGTTAEASKLRTRLPEAHRQFIEKLTKDGPVENVFVTREAFEALLQESKIDVSKTVEDLGAVDSYLESLSTGEPIKVSLSQMTKLIDNGLYTKLSGDIKFRNGPNDKTINEAEEEQEERVAAAERETTEAVAQVEPQLKRSADLQAGYERVLDHFLKVRGAIPKPIGLTDKQYQQLVKRDATLAAAMVTARASRENISVEESLALGPEEIRAGTEAEAKALKAPKKPAGQQPPETAAPLEQAGEPNLPSLLSIDPDLPDVKAQVDDWISREAAARGVPVSDRLIIQIGILAHDRVNDLMGSVAREMRGMTPEQKLEFVEKIDQHPSRTEANQVSKQMQAIVNAYPELAKQIPHSREEADAILADLPAIGQQEALLQESKKKKAQKKWIQPVASAEPQPVSPLAASVPLEGIEGAAGRLTRIVEREPEIGAPDNKRIALRNDGEELVVGKLTPQDWTARVEKNLTPDEIKKSRAWYGDLHRLMAGVFGEEAADRYALAWLLSQMNISPAGGMMNVLRAADEVAGLPAIKQAGLNAENLKKALRGEVPTEGFGAKLLDFIDSELQRKTRTAVGSDVRGGGPAVVDVWANRDVGKVDSVLKKHIVETFGKKAAAKVKVDGDVLGESDYEYGVRFYNDLAKTLNDLGYDGGDWKSFEAQAVGWMAFQREMGRKPQFPSDIFDLNTRNVSIGLKPGAGTGLEAAGEITPQAASQIVQAAAELARVKVRKALSAGGAYLGEREGSVQIEALGSPEALRDFAAVLGYALRQTEVIIVRPLDSGGSGGYTIVEEAGSVLGSKDGTEQFVARVREIMAAEGKFTIGDGYQMVVVKGKPALRFLHGRFDAKKGAVVWTGHWNEREKQAFRKAIDQASRELSIGVSGSYGNYEVISESNDWRKRKSGQGYRRSLLGRKRKALEGQLDLDSRLRLLPDAFGPAAGAGPGRAEAAGPGRGEPLQPAPPGRLEKAAPVQGLPQASPGVTQEVVDLAREYAEQAGVPHQRLQIFTPADPVRGSRIAKAYEALKHDPKNPEVKAAYAALIKETLAQFQLVKSLVEIEAIPAGQPDPYKSSKDMIADVRRGHLWFFPTAAGFGPEGAGIEHPLLAETKEKIGDSVLLANDVFRIVHDIFGHAQEGFPFGPSGEYNAYLTHRLMYSELAQQALRTETDGQNSWVNFGPFGEENRKNPKKTRFADQKAAVMPAEEEPLLQAAQKQPEGDGERIIKGAFLPDTNTLLLFEQHDQTSFIHEMSHSWLKHALVHARSGKADPKYLADWKVLAEHFKIAEDQVALTTQQQEAFARSIEAYFLTGEAPSQDLRFTFRRVRQWFVDIYRDIAGLEAEAGFKIEISPEMRAVMGRIFATDEQISAAQQLVGYQPEEVAGLDPQAAEEIRALQLKARMMAEEELLKEAMKGQLAARAVTVDRERERVTAEVTKAVDSDPMVAAMADLQNQLGKSKVPAEWAHRFKERNLTEDQQTKFYVMAELAGMSGDEFADAIIASKTRAERIKEGVDAKMALFDQPDRAQMREQALQSIHTDQTAELLALERGIITELIRGAEIKEEVAVRRREDARLEAQAVKEQAKLILAKKSIRDASAFRVFYTAERNAAQRVTRALVKKDLPAAEKAKREQLLNHALASESVRIRKEMERAARFLLPFERRQDLMGMPYAFVRQIDYLLAARGMAEPRIEDEITMLAIARDMDRKGDYPDAIANITGLVKDPNGTWIPESLASLVARINDEYRTVVLPETVFVQSPRQADEMSVTEMRGLRDAVKLLSEIGRKHERFLSAFVKADMKTAAKELRESIELKVGRPHADDRKLGSSYDSQLAKSVESISNLPNSATPLMVNLLTIATFLDGGEIDGPAHRLIYRLLKDAEREKFERMDKTMEAVNAIFAKHYSPDELRAYKEKNLRFDFLVNEDGSPRYMSREEALSVLLNWGNEGNRDRIRAGFGQYVGEEFVPLSDENIQKIIDVLAEKDVRFAQDVWDHLQTYWPEIVKLEMLTQGVQPEAVEAVAVQTKYGELRGGYYPIAFDFEKSAQAAKNADERNALYKQFSTAAAHTSRGHAKARVEGGVRRPVRLSLDVLFNHLENVVHDLAFRPAVIDLNRFLKESDARIAIENAAGIPGLRSIENTLKAVASDQGDHNGFWDSAIKSFRSGFTISVLGARLIRFLPDVAVNLSNTVWELGPSRARRAILEFARAPLESKAFVNDKSVLMKRRAKLIDRDIYDISRKWEGRSSAITQYAFVIQAAADELLSYPMWLEVYNHNLAEKGDRVAIQIADEAIARTFGSGSEIDRVGVQRGGEKQKLLSMFYSWNSMMFNRIWLEGKLGGLAYDEGNSGAVIAHSARLAVYGILMPAILEATIMEALRNARGKDEEGRRRRMLSKLFQAPFGYIWLVRDIASYVIDKTITGRATYRLSPIESAMETLLSPLADGANIAFTREKRLDQKYAEKVARSASAVMGYPQLANDIFFNVVDWIRGKGDLTWKDFISREKKK